MRMAWLLDQSSLCSFTAAVGCMAAFLLCAGSAIQAAEPAPKKQVLRHIVMYKFKDGLPQEKIDEVVAAFNKLPSQIVQIIGYEAGTNVSGEGKSEGFTHVFVVSFGNQKDLEAYLVHPAHLAYVNIVKDRREKVIVFDYWAQ